MSIISHVGSVSSGTEKYDYHITDLQLIDSGGSHLLISVTGATDGGVVTYSVAPDGGLTVADVSALAVSGVPGRGPFVTVTSGGSVWLGGSAPETVLSYSVSATGALGSPRAISGIRSDSPHLPLVAEIGGMVLLGSPKEQGITVYTSSGSALSNGVFVADTLRTHLANPSVLTTVSVAGSDYAIVGSQSEYGLSVIALNDGAPRVVESAGAENGIGIMVPTAVKTAVIGAQTYVFLASSASGGASGAITVFALDETGALTLADHVLDSRDTRFGRVQDLDVITVNDRTYVIAGGGDDGLSLFAVTPDGGLIHLDSIEDTTQIGLSGVVAVEFAEVSGELYLYVSTEGDPGVSQFHIDQQNPGLSFYGTEVADSMAGGAGADWLFGGSGDDTLSGDAGNDILYDGAGADRLTGGSGADLFVMAGDGDADTITDFDPSTDQIDLSRWSYLQSLGDVFITATSGGYLISYGDERLLVQPAAQINLTPDTIRSALILGGSRVWAPPSLTLTGSDGADTLTGSWGADTLSGGSGNDVLIGLGGDDHIYGGPGRDTAVLSVNKDDLTFVQVIGDTVILGSSEGMDLFVGVEVFQFADGAVLRENLRGALMIGSRFNDVLFGTEGQDRIFGEAGNDELRGLQSRDELHGGAGADQLFGGRHGDWIFGDDGPDYLHGNGGDDELWAGLGDDILRGGSRSDLLYGERGDDRLSGNNFPDQLFGGIGNDTLKGGGGDDLLDGGPGDDYLKGGSGADRFVFDTGHGADRIVDFTPGEDVLDLADALWSGTSVDEIASLTDEGILLSFSDSESLLLLGLTSTDGLDASLV